MDHKSVSTKLEAVKAGAVGAGAIGAWTLQDLSLIMAIASGAVATLYGLLQMVKFLRMWYLEEKQRDADRNP